MHHKEGYINTLLTQSVFIIDSEVVIVGSWHPTTDVNDDNILIIHDEGVAAQFLEEFRDMV